MRQTENNKQKLIPLRKFVVPGVYSSAYLSQLVQRNKLKAKRIGRNFYTCEDWFREYIERHGRDEKQNEFVKNFSKQDVYLDEQRKKRNKQVEKTNKDGNKSIVKFLSYKKIAVVSAVFVLLIINYYFLFVRDKQGQVAGVNEQKIATSSEIIVDK